MERSTPAGVPGLEGKKYWLSDIFSSPEGICFFVTDSDHQELARLTFRSEKHAQKSRAAMQIVLANAVAFVPALLVLLRTETRESRTSVAEK